MTAKKAAASRKKAPAAAKDKAEPEVAEAPPDETVVAPPEVEGEAYQQGFHGVSIDDEDYSIAAEVKRLSNEA